MARHGCRPQTAIFCLSRINPFCWRTQWLQGWWENRWDIHDWAHCTHCLSHKTLEFEGISFSWIWAYMLFVFEALPSLLRIFLKVSSFWLRPCFVYAYSFGTLVWLEIRLFHWSWLVFKPFLPVQGLFLWNNANFFSLWPIPLDGLSSGECLKEKHLAWLLWDQTVLRLAKMACKLFKLSHLCCKLI